MVMQISEQTANKETPKSKFTETFMRHIAHETIPISTLPTQTHTGQSVSAQIQRQTIDEHKRGDFWFADKTTDGRKD